MSLWEPTSEIVHCPTMHSNSLLGRLRLSSRQARVLFWAWWAVALLGAVLFWGSGTFPERRAEAGNVVNDMQIYREIAGEVRGGRGYYDIAAEILPKHYKYHSTFNWRLPTYAYLFAFLGSDT